MAVCRRFSGTFSLVPANAGTGAPAYLQFFLTGYSAVPEPSALLLLAPGALALFAVRKRRGA